MFSMKKIITLLLLAVATFSYSQSFKCSKAFTYNMISDKINHFEVNLVLKFTDSYIAINNESNTYLKVLSVEKIPMEEYETFYVITAIENKKNKKVYLGQVKNSNWVFINPKGKIVYNYIIAEQ